MADITTDDLQCYVGGQFVRADLKRQFQGPIAAIEDAGDGRAKIICAWLAEHNPNSQKSVVRSDIPVEYTFDLSQGRTMVLGENQFYYNSHACEGTAENPCNAKEHISLTIHLFPKGSMEVRVKEDGRKKLFGWRRLAKLGFFTAGGAGAVAAGIAGVKIERRRRRRRKKQDREE